MGYNVYMTKAGYALQAKLFAEGGELEITRVEVGSGVLPEDAGWRTLTGLVQSRAVATSTTPVRRDCTVNLEIEYRSDLNSGAEEPFQINEFGVFAIGAEGEEALILYGDLSDCPDTAVPLKYGGCVRRYPVQMEMGASANASLGYPAGAWMTHEEGETIVQTAKDEILRAIMMGEVTLPLMTGTGELLLTSLGTPIQATYNVVRENCGCSHNSSATAV